MPAPSAVTVWQPDPRNLPQCAAYHSTAFEILYGGAAGGGKSDLILGLARTQHLSSLLLRREFPDLERSLIERSLQFYGDKTQYNASKHVWRIGQRRIEFGHLERAGTPSISGDETQYASAAYDFIGFDQLEQFPRYVYEFLFSRARSTVKSQRVRVVSSANPTGEHIGWIMERWGAWLDETHPRPAQSGEIRWYKRDPDGVEVETDAADPDAVSRTFIAAKLADNPYLDDSYRRTLNFLPEPLRSALLNGDWNASIQDDAYQVIPRAWVKEAQARWTIDCPNIPLTALGVDVARGGDDQTVLARRYDNYFAELEKYPGAATPNGQAVATLVVQATESGDDTLALVNLDVIGVGSSAHDILAESRPVNGVNWANAAGSRDKSGQLSFINKRAEHWWALREALDPANGFNLALPPDPELLGDLIAPRWVMQTNGIKIESKEDIKKRLGRSPDCGDAVVLANAERHLSLVREYKDEPKVDSRWNPKTNYANIGGTGSRWRR